MTSASTRRSSCARMWIDDRLRRLLLASFALVALLLLPSSCTQADSAVAPVPSERSASAPSSSPVPASDGVPAGDPGSIAARSTVELPVYAQPGSSDPEVVLPARNEFGSPLVLLVLDVAEGPGGPWVQVLLPGRPNGRSAWAPSSSVTLNRVEHEIAVDLASRRLAVIADGVEVLATPIAIGEPQNPTPTGRFSVTDKLQAPDPGGAYGPFALGLSARSEVLTEFAGSDGQIGIHGTNVPESIGQAASHGCIRVPNEVVAQLAQLISLGTPVVVS